MTPARLQPPNGVLRLKAAALLLCAATCGLSAADPAPGPPPAKFLTLPGVIDDGGGRPGAATRCSTLSGRRR